MGGLDLEGMSWDLMDKLTFVKETRKKEDLGRVFWVEQW